LIGTALNHYRITAILGSGGMGEVYAAEDTKLDREVAIKLLPPAVAEQVERRRRFEQEARTIAALNHPNIVTIHSIEQAGEHTFLTMELVRGKVLAELIPPHGLPVERLLAIAIPLADGVSAAHQRGVIHRDLKPANVMVADQDRVKILDFGIARLTALGNSDGGGKALTTQLATSEHAVVGTVAYMSPEQAEGRALDTRSDVFSLGVVLYEMATGLQPFRGDTAVTVLSSIIKDQPPPITASQPALPGELARIVKRCLAKDPARRYQTAADVRNDLLELQEELTSGRVAQPTDVRRSARGRELAAWGAAATFAALAVFAFVPSLEREPAAPGVDVLAVLPPADVTLTEGEAPVLSPDGRILAFVATDASGRTRLYVRDRGASDARVLEETDDAAQPFWSPDSRSIGFFAAGQLKRVDLAGGRPRSLAAAPVPRGGTWSRNGDILFVGFPEDPPQLVDAAGGTARQLPVLSSGDWRWFPSWLPNGRDYIYQGGGFGGHPYGIVQGSLDSPESTLLIATSPPAGSDAIYVEPGYLLFRRERSVVAQRFDAAERQLVGEAITVVDDVGVSIGTGQTLVSASGSGSLAYIGPGHGWQLAWRDRAGNRIAPIGTVGDYSALCLSRGDRALVYDNGVNLWSLDLATAATTRLTFEHAFYAACAASSDEVVFAGTRTGPPNLFRLDLGAPGREQRLFSSPLPSLPSDWSRDGRFVLYSAYSRETSWDVWVAPLDGGEPFAYVATAAQEKNAEFSPDGRWVAYTSNQGGIDEIFVEPYPAGGGRWQISRGGGRHPHWRLDGRELFYVSLDKRLVGVEIDPTGTQLVHGAPQPLLDNVRGAEAERTHLGAPYVVTGNGQRFIVASPVDATRPITVVLNWPALLERAER
jgi:dipeptidyl aminopeptidase/acylaminoacyl peptidase